MNARRLLLFLGGYCCAQAEPEFIGLFSTKTSGTLFILTVESGTPPQWAKIGQTVGGYTVSDFNEKEETLLLVTEGRIIALKLKTSKVQRTDSRRQPMPLAAAKQMIASEEGWNSGVSYKVFRDSDGNWCLSAMKKVESALVFTFQVLTPESIPSDSPEIIEKDRPRKAPETTTDAQGPRQP